MPKATATNLLKEALALDAASNERAAIPLYRRAISQGLNPKDLHTALIGLGSSLRTVGEVPASIRTLQKARNLFPNDPAITLFLALSHRDAGQTDLALRQLADMLLKESRNNSLTPYREVLKQKYHALR
jgi:tetratricopeptide (TPR) repeat protein